MGFSHRTIRISLYVFYALVFACLVLIVITPRSFWFVPSPIVASMMFPAVLGCTIFGIFFSIIFWKEINDYRDNRPEPFFYSREYRDGPVWRFMGAVVNCAMIGLVTFIFLPALISFSTGTETEKTFDVTWTPKAYRSCAGYTVTGTPTFMATKICGVPHHVSKIVKKRGTITFRGYESVLGFKATEIISQEAK